MNLSWMFGSSLAAHHLLYAYLSVWFIQGGYCIWVAWQWKRIKTTSTNSRTDASSPANREDL
jgi:threonine/homoserine/homoserine lactone efflux protein